MYSVLMASLFWILRLLGSLELIEHGQRLSNLSDNSSVCKQKRGVSGIRGSRSGMSTRAQLTDGNQAVSRLLMFWARNTTPSIDCSPFRAGIEKPHDTVGCNFRPFRVFRCIRPTPVLIMKARVNLVLMASKNEVFLSSGEPGAVSDPPRCKVHRTG